MKTKLMGIIFTLLCVSAYGDDTCRTLICKLGEELKHLRSLPAGTKTRSICPEKRDSLLGLNRNEVLTYLGEQNWPIEKAKEQENILVYFFTPKTPNVAFGGGFPELTFFFSNEDFVIKTTCFYSR